MVNTQDFVGMFCQVATPVMQWIMQQDCHPSLCNGLCNSKHTKFCWNVFFELRINQLFSFFREKMLCFILLASIGHRQPGRGLCCVLLPVPGPLCQCARKCLVKTDARKCLVKTDFLKFFYPAQNLLAPRLISIV